jgi:hypothetical protein
MFKWLGKIRLWRRESAPDPYIILEYGQYVHKPVVARAVSMIMGVSQDELCSWINDPEMDLFLNDELIQGSEGAQRRLGSGSYEIKIPSQRRVWRFFIA